MCPATSAKKCFFLVSVCANACTYVCMYIHVRTVHPVTGAWCDGPQQHYGPWPWIRSSLRVRPWIHMILFGWFCRGGIGRARSDLHTFSQALGMCGWRLSSRSSQSPTAQYVIGRSAMRHNNIRVVHWSRFEERCNVFPVQSTCLTTYLWCVSSSREQRVRNYVS